jgi:aryl carrier-like protein
VTDGGRLGDDEVVEVVRTFLARRGTPCERVTAETELAELGLDSIALVELLLSAREECVARGLIQPYAGFSRIPELDRVADLTRHLNILIEMGRRR